MGSVAWLDVFFHGGLLARLYVEPSPFFLAPEEAFRRIPLGYLAFLGLTGALYWLFRRLGVRGAVAGFRYGAVAGVVELGLAGAALGAAGKGVSLNRIWTVVAVAVVLFAAATVALQSLGLAPPMKIAR